MGKKANEKELIKVAKELESTTDETKQIALLQVFINAAYPLPIDFLLKFSHNPNKVLAGAAAEVLENIKDERIHDLATELMKDKELSVYALGLFVQNFQNDYDLILDLLKKEHEQFIIEKSGFYFHSLTLGVRNIFKHNKSIESLDILHFLYQKTTCSHCRREIVQIMCDNNILPDRIAEEGRYDCDVDTREMIVEYLGNIK
jgi:hypothetical protein